MSAEILRRAASLMRERAEAATTQEFWVRGYAGDADSLHINYAPFMYAPISGGTAENREHIASWHPTVALAVADWLDATAAENDSPEDSALGFLNFVGADALAALAVARAYLGGAA